MGDTYGRQEKTKSGSENTIWVECNDLGACKSFNEKRIN